MRGIDAAPSVLDEALADLDMISLDELNAQARLMTRVDRKYFAPRALVAQIMAATRDDFAVLTIDGLRRFEYRTVYFDSSDFRFFRDHVQRRRRRYKVRTRTYVDTGSCHLEVKSKGYRGQTVKQRIAHPLDSPRSLTDQSREYIDSIITPDGAPALSARSPIRARDLVPVLETIYDRFTVCHGDQRVTCDLDIRAVNGSDVRTGPADVLVETKSTGSGSTWDRLLREAGIRPHSVSKYCVSAALLHPQLPRNPWRQTIAEHFARR